jgi:hypothetical protein
MRYDERHDLARRTGLIGARRILKSITGKLPDETATARLGELFKEQRLTPVLDVITARCPDCWAAPTRRHVVDKSSYAIEGADLVGDHEGTLRVNRMLRENPVDLSHPRSIKRTIGAVSNCGVGLAVMALSPC